MQSPLTQSQYGLYVECMSHLGEAYYNLPYLYVLDPSLDGERLRVSDPAMRPVKEAIVTMGGVSLSEVDPATMMSRKVPGLYFAGEVLDIDGDCGGFNLQWAWASGTLAGRLGR